tara:strand:+ start:335 stop:481 length:147 start_codon:yes stop_codon:yes gene_type:complete
MTNNHHEESLKAAKRAEIERLYFEMELNDEQLLAEYKALDVKGEDKPN